MNSGNDISQSAVAPGRLELELEYHLSGGVGPYVLSGLGQGRAIDVAAQPPNAWRS